MTRQFYLAPSILSANPLAIGQDLDRLEGCYDWIHVDIMDGHFVPNLTYGPSLVKALRKAYPQGFIDTHLMVEPSEKFLEMFLESGPSQLMIHQETTKHLHRSLMLIKDRGVKAGVVINPATAVCLVEPVLPLVDCVLLMSVNPGFGGQSFIPSTLEKARQLDLIRQKQGLEFIIEMDGGLSLKNLAQAVEAGVDAAVMGSALFGASDPIAVARESKQIAMEVFARVGA